MNKVSKRKTDSVYSAVGKGIFVALLLCLVGAITGAVLLSNQLISESAIFITSVIIWTIAAFGGSMISLNSAQSKCLLSVLLTNICFLFVLAGTGILFFDSNFKCVLAAFLAIIAGGVVAVLLFLNRSPKKSSKFRYKR